MKRLIKFFKDKEGATAIEYAMIAALISVAAVVIWGTVGGAIVTTFGTVATALGS